MMSGSNGAKLLAVVQSRTEKGRAFSASNPVNQARLIGPKTQALWVLPMGRFGRFFTDHSRFSEAASKRIRPPRLREERGSGLRGQSFVVEGGDVRSTGLRGSGDGASWRRRPHMRPSVTVEPGGFGWSKASQQRQTKARVRGMHQPPRGSMAHDDEQDRRGGGVPEMDGDWRLETGDWRLEAVSVVPVWLDARQRQNGKADDTIVCSKLAAQRRSYMMLSLLVLELVLLLLVLRTTLEGHLPHRLSLASHSQATTSYEQHAKHASALISKALSMRTTTGLFRALSLLSGHKSTSSGYGVGLCGSSSAVPSLSLPWRAWVGQLRAQPILVLSLSEHLLSPSWILPPGGVADGIPS
ncbi:uncharacterized protein Triagg1_4862 [Trichoderma aggressivum f. europaeum]|uniref:Uncharacterized protein n=1 Tax=Trichoderma aggressivum f. europaeum TaxID=173218 RepID=A0AAE1IDV3_9HYPO|nr:hypothetical protein Triagg1_4862 [Trichoderma aggressivum f. europaeum]